MSLNRLTARWAFLCFVILAANTSPAHAHRFWWGVSTSSYQIEEAPSPHERFFQTDWDLFFSAGSLHFPKGQGTMSFSRMDRDIEAMKKLGVSHYRFSVEWARIEPQPGVYNLEALERYAWFCRRLQSSGITPLVTLWHFTFPSWLTDLARPDRHGWLHPTALPRWEAFVRRVVTAFGDSVAAYMPLNEPNVQALAAFVAGIFPPGAMMRQDLYMKNMQREVEAHLIAARIVKQAFPKIKVISVQALTDWEHAWWDIGDTWWNLMQEYNFYHLDRVANASDWIGFNYYFTEVASPFALMEQGQRTGDHVSDLGWRISPEGLGRLLRQVYKRYKKPVVITENGIADASDVKRQNYLRCHVAEIFKALQDGVDVRGYFHWSLVDNFEWASGYAPQFGLYSFSLKEPDILTPKASATLYHDIITGFNTRNDTLLTCH